MTKLKRFILAASVGIGTLLMCSPASATQLFPFNGVRGELKDGDRFEIIFQTEDNLTTTIPSPALAHTNPLVPGLTSPAYTFEGYLITGISGFWYEADDPNTPLTISALLPIHSIVENETPPPEGSPPGTEGPLDIIAHSPTDNLFNPNGGFVPSIGVPSINVVGGIGGKLSYGGVAFVVDHGNGVTENYQLFTDPDPVTGGGYAGCPGTCVVVTEVDGPGTLPLMGVGLAFAWSRVIRRRGDTAKGQGHNSGALRIALNG